jgi:hypothetical protein
LQGCRHPVDKVGRGGSLGLVAAGEKEEAEASEGESVGQFHIVEVIGFGKLSRFAGIKIRQFAEKKN